MIKQHTIHKAFKLFGVKATKQSIVESGFFTLQGMLGAIVLNDLWRLFNLPGENVPVVIDGKPIGRDWDNIYQMGLGIGLMSMEYVFKQKHFGAFGAGVVLGSNFANKSEGTFSHGNKNKGTYIGVMS